MHRCQFWFQISSGLHEFCYHYNPIHSIKCASHNKYIIPYVVIGLKYKEI